jgi:hypothetical protein
MVSLDPREVGVEKAVGALPPLRARAKSSVRCDDTLDWRPPENIGKEPGWPAAGAERFFDGAERLAVVSRSSGN